MEKLLLGVDIGTNESKGILINQSFRPVAEFAVPHAMENPKPNHFEMDANIWWDDFCKITKGLIPGTSGASGKSGRPGRDICAAGIDPG